MKKTIIALLFMLAGVTLWAAPEPHENFAIDPVSARVAAGTIIPIDFEVKCANGYSLQGVSAFVHRKNATASFFAQDGIKINRHFKNTPVKDSPYDAIYFINEVMRQGIKEGKIRVDLNSAGMTAGDYAIAMRGYFTKKGAKSLYRSIYFVLTITRGDNGKFAITPQPRLHSDK